MTTITYDEWVDTYKPITDEHGQPRGFETYGEDYDIVKAVDNNQLWTWVDGGDYSVIHNGYSFVNRLHYYISTVPWKEEHIEIDMYEPDECETEGHSYKMYKRSDDNEYECCENCGLDRIDIEQYGY